MIETIRLIKKDSEKKDLSTDQIFGSFETEETKKEEQIIKMNTWSIYLLATGICILMLFSSLVVFLKNNGQHQIFLKHTQSLTNK